MCEQLFIYKLSVSQDQCEYKRASFPSPSSYFIMSPFLVLSFPEITGHLNGVTNTVLAFLFVTFNLYS